MSPGGLRSPEPETADELLALAASVADVGRIARGLAHDFSNLLGLIIGFSSYLVEDLPDGSDQQAYATRILTACEHGKALVAQLVRCASGRDRELRRVDLVATVETWRELLRISVPRSVQLVIELPSYPLPVRADEQQLAQVLLNLCLNARDAIGEGPGTITIALEACVGNHDLPRPAGSWPVAPVGVARIRVSDTGSGIAPEVLKRIFEPFFTTKQARGGSGLGLAIVRTLVEAHGGSIAVSSTPGRGSRFDVYLPIERNPGGEAASRAEPGDPPCRRSPNDVRC